MNETKNRIIFFPLLGEGVRERVNCIVTIMRLRIKFAMTGLLINKFSVTFLNSIAICGKYCTIEAVIL